MESAEEFIKRKEEEFRRKDHKIKAKDIGRKGKHEFIHKDWFFVSQHNNPEKVFLIEKLERNKIEGEAENKNLGIGDIEYRIGYYIVGKNGTKAGKWTWGQYCPFIPPEDYKKIVKEIEERKW